MQLQSMYQEIILDHYRNPHGRGLREPFEAEVHHVNPTCGDEVTLRVHLDGDTLADVSYEGMGCSISQASVSAMYELVIGRSVPEALETGEHFMTLMQSKGDASVAEKLEDELEDAIAFAGVSKYPARIKCALMSWMALKDASARALAATPASATQPTTAAPVTHPTTAAPVTHPTTPTGGDRA
jgi:nitrogen fixation NifU-like protein